jgi:hypothetical protein
MKTRALVGVVALLPLFSPQCAARGADFYVAPDGKDANPGTAAAPFATVAKARDAVRRNVAAGLTKDILVQIRGGTYHQTETLTFGPQDSGTEKYSITYAAAPGETVVLSGGRSIAGWKKGDGQTWTTEIPEVKAGKWQFRQLFVGGKRAVRARTPNIDDQAPWWHIRTSTITNDVFPSEDVPITVSVTGPIKAYRNLRDVELVFIANNNGSRKFLGTVDEKAQTLTLPGPHHWNPKVFGTEWIYNIPCQGLACYLENAPEMLDQPGEWYLDRQTGVLTYWPRAGEDLTRDEVVVPVVPKTLLAVRGTPERRVVNLHFRGLEVQHVEWFVPSWGYLGLAVCTRTHGAGPTPGWEFVDAAVEYEHAQTCSFAGGRIAHVGSIGLCLRRGTAGIVVEGNEIGDTGAGGIGAGYMENAAYGYLHAPPPAPNEATGYRIANNHIHHCGTDDYAAAGVLLGESKDCVVAHNLIHDTAYFGIGFAGSQDPKSQFARNNVIEYNHVFHAMKVTADGAGMYVTFTQHEPGSLIRGNLIHDIVPNRFHNRPVGPFTAAGIYLDGNNNGCRYEGNVTYRACAVYFFCGHRAQDNNNAWIDNVFLDQGAPPQEFVEAMQGYAGPEAAYRRALLGADSPVSDYYPLTQHTGKNDVWSGRQFHRAQTGDGAVEVIRRGGAKEESARMKLRGLDAAASYELKLATSSAIEKTFLAAPPQPADSALVEGKSRMTGRQLMTQGLVVKAQPGQIVWIAYRQSQSR